MAIGRAGSSPAFGTKNVFEVFGVTCFQSAGVYKVGWRLKVELRWVSQQDVHGSLLEAIEFKKFLLDFIHWVR